MSKKMSVDAVIGAGGGSNVVDAKLAAADVITPMSAPPAKPLPQSKFNESDVDNLTKQVRGSIPFVIKSGTEKVLPLNGNHPSLNQGALEPNHSNQHVLKIDLERMKVAK